MSEDARRQIDPESLSKKNIESIASLSDIFCTGLKRKVALVTGGASGLGYTVVNRLCEAGAKVVIASRKEERGMRAVNDFKEKGYDVSWVKTDVTKVDDCYHAVDFTAKTYGSLDILVANAAGWSSYSYLDCPESVFDRVVDTDLKGAYFTGQAAARYMVANKVKGKIVFISSAAHMGEGPSCIGMNTYYIAAKAGVAAMTKGIAGELKQYGISVNCVALAVYALCTPMSDFMVGEVAAGGVADGSEMVIFDLLGFIPPEAYAKHSKGYATTMIDCIKGCAAFDQEVKNKVYPAEENGWGMNEAELDKFVNELEKSYPDVK